MSSGEIRLPGFGGIPQRDGYRDGVAGHRRIGIWVPVVRSVEVGAIFVCLFVLRLCVRTAFQLVVLFIARLETVTLNISEFLVLPVMGCRPDFLLFGFVVRHGYMSCRSWLWLCIFLFLSFCLWIAFLLSPPVILNPHFSIFFIILKVRYCWRTASSHFHDVWMGHVIREGYSLFLIVYVRFTRTVLDNLNVNGVYRVELIFFFTNTCRLARLTFVSVGGRLHWLSCNRYLMRGTEHTLVKE